MFCINNNALIVNGQNVLFDNQIRKVIEYKNNFLVLLDIPIKSNEINNLYCINESGNVIWRVEDLNDIIPTKNKRPYEGMQISKDTLVAYDCFSRNFEIDITSGKFIKMLSTGR